MGYAMISVNPISSQGKLGAAYSHNYRIDHAENAAKDLSKNNKELISLYGRTYEEKLEETIRRLPYYKDHNIRKNGVLAVEVVTRISAEDAKRINLEKWQQDNIEFIRGRFNGNVLRYGDNVISSVFHADEVVEVNGELKGTYHMHTVVIPIDTKGKLNYSSFVNGPKDMTQLQTDYAKAMAVHGLKRGVEKSVASHESMKRFYAGINQALSETAPEIIPGETVESYKQRADEAMKENCLRAYAAQKEKEHELVRKYNQKQEGIKQELKQLKEESKELHQTVKISKRRDDELIHEFGSWEEIEQKLKSMDCLVTAFKNFPDKEKSEQVRTDMNDFIRFGQQEREKERKKKERKSKQPTEN